MTVSHCLCEASPLFFRAKSKKRPDPKITNCQALGSAGCQLFLSDPHTAGVATGPHQLVDLLSGFFLSSLQAGKPYFSALLHFLRLLPSACPGASLAPDLSPETVP